MPPLLFRVPKLINMSYPVERHVECHGSTEGLSRRPRSTSVCVLMFFDIPSDPVGYGSPPENLGPRSKLHSFLEISTFSCSRDYPLKISK